MHGCGEITQWLGCSCPEEEQQHLSCTVRIFPSLLVLPTEECEIMCSRQWWQETKVDWLSVVTGDEGRLVNSCMCLRLQGTMKTLITLFAKQVGLSRFSAPWGASSRISQSTSKLLACKNLGGRAYIWRGLIVGDYGKRKLFKEAGKHVVTPVLSLLSLGRPWWQTLSLNGKELMNVLFLALATTCTASFSAAISCLMPCFGIFKKEFSL